MSTNADEGKSAAADAPSHSQEFGRKRGEVHISWDEPTIAEHDKLRGTRQKIDEPSTPYHYGSGESSTGSDCESTDGKGPSLSASSSAAGSPHQRTSRSGSVSSNSGGGDRRGSILKVMADVSAALPSESALRKERQARWDSDVSEGSSREDKEKARKFKQHREAHYNEFKALQEWRNKRSGDEMDEDSDSDCGNDDGAKGDTAEDRRRRRPAAAAAAAAAAATTASAADTTGTGDMSVDEEAGDASEKMTGGDSAAVAKR